MHADFIRKDGIGSRKRFWETNLCNEAFGKSQKRAVRESNLTEKGIPGGYAKVR